MTTVPISKAIIKQVQVRNVSLNEDLAINQVKRWLMKREFSKWVSKPTKTVAYKLFIDLK